MWYDLSNYISAVLVVLGSLFALVGAMGILRLPDVYSRSHAASKAGAIGSGLAMLAIAVSAPEPYVATRAIAGLLFFLFTTPVSAHLLMRAAYKAGYPMWSGAVADEMPVTKTDIEVDS